MPLTRPPRLRPRKPKKDPTFFHRQQFNKFKAIAKSKTIDRSLTIGQSSFIYGFEASNFGDLSPVNWFDNADTVSALTVDALIDEVSFSSVGGLQWNGQSTVIIKTQGTDDIVLTWDSVSSYKLIDATYTSYISGLLGSSVEIDIFPKP